MYDAGDDWANYFGYCREFLRRHWLPVTLFVLLAMSLMFRGSGNSPATIQTQIDQPLRVVVEEPPGRRWVKTPRGGLELVP